MVSQAQRLRQISFVTNINRFIVFPEGPKAIVGQELSGEYYEKAAPVLDKQVARAGYRMAAWLDKIVDQYLKLEASYTGELPTEDYMEEPLDEFMEEPIGEL